MFQALLNRDEPVRVEDDVPLQDATRAKKEAEAELQKIQTQYVRLKTLVTPPANQTLADLGATSEEQDAAIVQFPAVVQAYGVAKDRAARTRRTYEAAHAAAYGLRQTWYTDRLREKERALVELISGPVYDLVQEIHSVIEEAACEEVRVEPTALPDVPLRMGCSQQGGLEQVLPTLERLVKKH